MRVKILTSWFYISFKLNLIFGEFPYRTSRVPTANPSEAVGKEFPAGFRLTLVFSIYAENSRLYIIHVSDKFVLNYHYQFSIVSYLLNVFVGEVNVFPAAQKVSGFLKWFSNSGVKNNDSYSMRKISILNVDGIKTFKKPIACSTCKCMHRFPTFSTYYLILIKQKIIQKDKKIWTKIWIKLAA